MWPFTLVAKTSVRSVAGERPHRRGAGEPAEHPLLAERRAGDQPGTPVLRHEPFGAEPTDRNRRDLHAAGTHHAGDPRRGADPLGGPPGDVPVENPIAETLVVADRDGDARPVHRDRPDRAAGDERPRRPGDDPHDRGAGHVLDHRRAVPERGLALTVVEDHTLLVEHRGERATVGPEVAEEPVREPHGEDSLALRGEHGDPAGALERLRPGG